MLKPAPAKPITKMPLAPLDCVADLVVDARGLRCPLPLLQAKQGLRNLTAGALLHVKASDSASVRDFQAYAKISGNELEGFRETAGEFEYWLRKKVD